jgi:hypothetical protein
VTSRVFFWENGEWQMGSASAVSATAELDSVLMIMVDPWRRDERVRRGTDTASHELHPMNFMLRLP